MEELRLLVYSLWISTTGLGWSPKPRLSLEGNPTFCLSRWRETNFSRSPSNPIWTSPKSLLDPALSSWLYRPLLGWFSPCSKLPISFLSPLWLKLLLLLAASTPLPLILSCGLDGLVKRNGLGFGPLSFGTPELIPRPKVPSKYLGPTPSCWELTISLIFSLVFALIPSPPRRLVAPSFPRLDLRVLSASLRVSLDCN